ncbi:MAG: F0F1 ATP synthase subunit epsilon [Rhodospirillaceae bacterium]|nr:F0F1 ATP synthase subunit epsilon [Rhodospirillaceae bacterium]
MAADKVEFELVSPERLLVSEQVDMVVVPGAEGDFGVLPRHAPLISSLRAGVIRVFEGRDVKQRIFVAGGFAEVTGERCTVLAEEALPVGDIDTGKIEQELKTLEEDLGDAKTEDERAAVARRIAVRQAMRAAAGQSA